MPMLRKVKSEWVKALRSGKYKQGRGFLRTPRREYCCLGILAKTQGAKFDSFGRFRIRDSSNYSGFVLDKNLSFGLTEKQKTRLMKMNDMQCLSFKQIASWVVKNVKVKKVAKKKK